MNFKAKVSIINTIFKKTEDKAEAFLRILKKEGTNWTMESKKENTEFHFSCPKNRNHVIFKSNGKTIVRELQRSAKANNIAVLSN